MNKKFIGAIALALVVVVSGCVDTSDKQVKKQQQDLNKVQDTSGVAVGSSFLWESKLTEKNQQELAKKYPPLQLEDSLERQNLRQRYKHLNDRDVVHHVYLMSYGKVVAYYTAQGKVSSVNSKLTQEEQIVKQPNCDSGGSGYSEGPCYKVVSSPQMDGSYGTNGAAIFFFTTDGRYVEWNGEYLVSDQPLSIQTPVTLTQKAK